jgi:hypothetical protein
LLLFPEKFLCGLHWIFARCRKNQGEAGGVCGRRLEDDACLLDGTKLDYRAQKKPVLA